jgi:hypothetical protein
VWGVVMPEVLMLEALIARLLGRTEAVRIEPQGGFWSGAHYLRRPTTLQPLVKKRVLKLEQRVIEVASA